MNRGRLITIEGIDGAGKTTLAAALLDALAARGLDVLLLREPGGVPAAERIRELVMDPDLHVTRAHRGAALRRGPGAARRGGDRAAPARGPLGPARPVRRLLARLPGRRARARDRPGARDQRVRDPTARPDRTLLLTIDSELGRGAVALAGGTARPPRTRAGRLLRPDRGGLPRAGRGGPGPDPDDRRYAAR